MREPPAWLEGKEYYRTRCKSLRCRKDIVMVRVVLQPERYHPFDLDGTSHFKTCIDARTFKRTPDDGLHADQRKLEVA